MKRTTLLFVALAMLLALLPSGKVHATGSLEATTTHTMVVPPVFEDDRYMLAWHGEIAGDVNGYIEWWIDTLNWTAWEYVANDRPLPAESHYVEKVKIYDSEGGTPILEALSRGKTTTTTSTWWANGTVVYADAELFPGLEGRGVLESGMFDLTTTPPSGTSTFTVTTDPIVIGMVLVDAKSDEDVGPLLDGTIIDLGATPQFNIRVETAPTTVGSTGFGMHDLHGNEVPYRMDGKSVENFKPMAAGGDWPVGNYLPMTLKRGTYTVKATAHSGGSRHGTAGPTYEVTFSVATPFTVSAAGEVIAITTDPELVTERCTAPSWAFVTFGGSGTSPQLGPLTALAENCSYVGELPDGTIGPNGTYGEGVLTITDENGDVLNATYTDGMTLVPPPLTEFADTFTLIGGTGRFAAAVGGGVETGIADFTAGLLPGAPFTLVMEGVIAY